MVRFTAWVRGILWFALLGLTGVFAVGCVANDTPPTPAAQSTSVDLSFDCEDGERLSLVGDGVTLMATDTEDASVRLEAAPPGQTSRYGADGHALVINNGEALWMKAGAAPMTCRR